MLVLMKIGVTSRIWPEAAAVELVSDAGPCWKPICVSVPIAAVPTVQGAPSTVKVVDDPKNAAPPTPTTLSGTWRFAGGGAVAPLQGSKKQTFATPANGMGPLSGAPANAPALLCTVSCRPESGPAIVVLATVIPAAEKGDAGMLSVLMCEPAPTVATPEPGAEIGVSGTPAKNWRVKAPVKGNVPACASAAIQPRAITARIGNNLRMGSPCSGAARFPATHPTPPREGQRRESRPEQQHRSRLGHEVEAQDAEYRHYVG